jgi:hypothetical protein
MNNYLSTPNGKLKPSIQCGSRQIVKDFKYVNAVKITINQQKPPLVLLRPPRYFRLTGGCSLLHITWDLLIPYFLHI